MLYLAESPGEWVLSGDKKELFINRSRAFDSGFSVPTGHRLSLT